ncbi:Y phosphatase domain containing protein [Trichuris trichiura]|uniref:Y phosphatase domain containing protein n=1 Tax=Trichuris trichiura TaxID=36087 RepID=A0A077YXV9_TRITR|nr:Y phosphatase domain containing protein [Trichuris trichiura]
MSSNSSSETSQSLEVLAKSSAVKWATDTLNNSQNFVQNIFAEFCKLQAQQSASKNPAGVGQEEKSKSAVSSGNVASVELSKGELKEEQKHKSTFIHINRINLPKLPCEFILTRAPSDETVVDFWTTVWKEYVKVIVYIENSEATKSEIALGPYWPKVFGLKEHHCFGKYRIRPIYGQVAKSYTQKILEVKNLESNESRWVRHLVYADWPKEEAAMSTESLFDFIRKVDEELEKGKKDSMVYPFRVLVHDAMGTSRSATFVILRSLIGVIKIGQTPLIPQTVSILLEQQAYWIHEPRLYYYIYYALIKYIMANWDIPKDVRNDWLKKAKLIRRKSVRT